MIEGSLDIEDKKVKVGLAPILFVAIFVIGFIVCTIEIIVFLWNCLFT